MSILTKAQKALLAEVAAKDEYVVDAYSPGQALRKLGLVSEASRPDDYGAFLAITPAGREALAKASA